MGKHTVSDLYQMQSLPLSAKIQMTERRIREWVEYYGTDGTAVSFSGGKDNGKKSKMKRDITLTSKISINKAKEPKLLLRFFP